MKESISVTAIFQIFILFVLLFTAIMCLTINNSNAFGVKDEIINIIEYSNGNIFENTSMGRTLNDDIVEAIAAAQYRTTGECDDGYTGYQKDGTPVNSGEKAAICIREVDTIKAMEDYLKSVPNLGNVVMSNDMFMEGKYYQIVVFYQLDIPIINQVYKMQTKGETKIIYE